MVSSSIEELCQMTWQSVRCQLLAVASSPHIMTPRQLRCLMTAKVSRPLLMSFFSNVCDRHREYPHLLACAAIAIGKVTKSGQQV